MAPHADYTNDANGINGTNHKVKVIVVGAGFAGMTAAIECRVRGMDVVLVEKYNDSSQYGDIIDFFANAGRIIAGWDDGKVTEKLLEICITEAKYMQIRKHTGELIHNDPWYLKSEHARYQFAGQRGAMWKIFQEYAERIGVEMHFGRGVVDYFEQEGSAGIELSDGTIMSGDCVIVGDGPKSLAREKALGLKDEKTNSGFAIYRCYFPMNDEVRTNPLLKDYTNTEEDIIKIWIGPQTHMLAYSWMKGTKVVWVFTHPDDDDVIESWSEKVDKETVLKYLKDYHPECKALINASPPNSIIDYKLVWREPIRTWRSNGGRIVLIGDAAHCHLPTSGQGGSQAMEDGLVAAVCLDKAKGDVRLALQVMERIRFNRSHVTHQAGSEIRETWHENPWDKVEEDPEKIAMARGDWILDFDPRANAEEHFEQLAKDVKEGRKGSIEELSLPAGGEYISIL